MNVKAMWETSQQTMARSKRRAAHTTCCTWPCPLDSPTQGSDKPRGTVKQFDSLTTTEASFKLNLNTLNHIRYKILRETK